jgi:hypothetical protein
MTPGNDEIKYKNLFRKIEEETDIPEFDDILNLPVLPKKNSGKLVKAGLLMVVCLTLVTGIYFYQRKTQGAGVAKNETTFFQDKKSLLWEWKSPTQPLLSTALTSTFTDFNIPTDHLFSLKTSLQFDNEKKQTKKNEK